MTALDTAAVQRWLDAYIDAWSHNDITAIGTLFSADGCYRGRPSSAGARGTAEIERHWREHVDEPGTWWARLAPLLVHDDTAIVTGEVDYDNGELYSNLWVLRFDDAGRCADFTEWWMRRDSGVE